MSDPVGRWLLLEIVFLFLGVFCALASSGFRECSESKLMEAAEEGDKKAEKMLPVVQEPDDFCATLRVGAVGFGFFAVTNPLTAGAIAWIESRIPAGYAVQEFVGGVIWVVLLMLAVALMDLTTERYAWHRADQIVRKVFGLACVLETLLRPVSWLLLRVANLALRICGVNNSVVSVNVVCFCSTVGVGLKVKNIGGLTVYGIGSNLGFVLGNVRGGASGFNIVCSNRTRVCSNLLNENVVKVNVVCCGAP